MSAKLEALSHNLQKHLGDRVKSLKIALGEVTIEVDAADYLSVMQTLRDEPELAFEELIDLCGIDYSVYANVPREGQALCRRQSSAVDCSELATARSLLCAG
jgi:NADH-quinone oxidoreductase subunit C